MEVELFREPVEKDWIMQKLEYDRVQVKQDREALCNELGLKRQIGIGSEDPDFLYKRMRGEELAIWSQFLPTVYSTNNHAGGHAWGNYQFDQIPVDCLEEIVFAKRTELFHDLAIWTPELSMGGKIDHDPMCVGMANRGNVRKFYKIVRWGEALIPLEEAKKKVWNHLLGWRLRDSGILNTFSEEAEKLFVNHYMRLTGFSWLHECCGERMIKGLSGKTKVIYCWVCGHWGEV